MVSLEAFYLQFCCVTHLAVATFESHSVTRLAGASLEAFYLEFFELGGVLHLTMANI